MNPKPPRKLNIAVPSIKLHKFILIPETFVIFFGIEIDEIFPGRSKQKFFEKGSVEQTAFCRSYDIMFQKNPLISIYYSLFRSYITMSLQSGL